MPVEIGVSEDRLFELARYRQEIETWNPEYRLVGAKDRRELTVKHILDSLAPVGLLSRLLEAGSALADVGSGAGLPGIPLALILREYRFTLIEARGKRAKFLAETAGLLGLTHTRVERTDMEQAVPGRFRAAVFRAFKPLEPKLLGALFRLLAPEGILAAYKGRRDKIDAEMQAIPFLSGLWEAIPLRVPFLEEERHLVIIRRP
jgi:16S rRNA (guanine527-N7)-methyltransferase